MPLLPTTFIHLSVVCWLGTRMSPLAWMQEHLPRDAYLGISVTELNVLPSDRIEGYTGGDAESGLRP